MKKNIIIFGANSFIAKAFMNDYQDAFNVIPVYKRDKKFSLDFNKPSQIAKLRRQLALKLDAVVFCQGMNPAESAKAISVSHFREMLQVNIVTPALIIQQLHQHFNEGASVIFFSSVAKRKGSYDPSYAAAKSGIIGLMYSLANAYSEIRFNAISPGLVEGSPVFMNMTDDFRKRHAGQMYNNAFVQVRDISDAILMLINNRSFNKTDIEIDGGYK